MLRVSGRFELSRVRVTEGKITVNVRRKSRGNRFCFELAGFELSAVSLPSPSLVVLRAGAQRNQIKSGIPNDTVICLICIQQSIIM